MRSLIVALNAIGLLFLFPAVATAQRQMETLSRGVVATVQADRQVFVSWRLLGTESPETSFNLYRKTGDAAPLKLNDRPLDRGTWFLDPAPDLRQINAYTVHAVTAEGEQPAGKPFLLPAHAEPKPYLSIPLSRIDGYSPNDASVGDLDGDGDYEIILHQAGRAKDNSQSGPTDPPILQAYTLHGKLLWTIQLGPNIREGAHYTQFMVYDLDGDGRAEVVCKTADGTTDAAGTVIGDAAARHANKEGRILQGPEFLTVFDGRTGTILATTDYTPARNDKGDDMKALWGDAYGNRVDRFLACVAYLDGVRPSVVMCRGYYTRTVLAAYDWRDGKLVHRWTFDSAAPGNEKYAGQGNHNLSVADIDEDGRDEIVYGGMAIDDDGKGLWSTGLGHGDAMHVADIDPSNPGLEMFRIQERFDDAGAHLVDLRTGNVLWRKPSRKAATSGGDKGEGPGRGLSIDIDPRHPGAESWVFGAGITGLFDSRGNLITADHPRSCNFAIWWDGDELRELLDRTTISKWDYQNSKLLPLLDAKAFDCVSINGTKANPCLSADLLGDWREEVLFATADGSELRLFTTTIPTDRRLFTLMHDPQYRLSIAWQNVAYNQPPHTGFRLGADMPTPLPPKITTVPAR